jgi:hypothetical protein
MGRRWHARHWIVAGLAAVLGAGSLVVCVTLAADPLGSDVVTRFTSPSGHRVIVVTEHCFIKGCSNEVALEGRWRNVPLGSAAIDGDPEGAVFSHATVTWNADETRATWETHFRHDGGAQGVWVLPAK